METYNGHVRTPTDAIILFEACRLGLLPRVQRRLSEKERQSIRSGSVFVWDEREAGMRRWTDGKSWSASRVSGSFLTYREMEGKRGGSTFAGPTDKGTKSPDNTAADQQMDPEMEEGPDGYRYKPDGLMKQSFSITTSQGQHLHLISYFSRSHPPAQIIRQPSTDPGLSSIKPAPGMYPETTVNDQSSVPAVTRSPMPGAPNYVMAAQPGYSRPGPTPPHAYLPPGYIPHPGYMYGIDPMNSPPPHYALQYAAPPPGALPPLGYPGGPYGQPNLPINHAPPSSYDQRPLRTNDYRPSIPPPPPPPPNAPSQPPSANTPQQHGGAPSTASPFPQHQPPLHPPYQSNRYSDMPPNPTPNKFTPSQIDPRLTGAIPTNGNQNQTNRRSPEESKEESKSSDPGTSHASQAPSIDALVNGPTIHSSEGQSESEKASDRQKSSSPGGNRNGAPPQDIPSEKLGFREDKRALSKLDSVFARV